MKLLWIPVGIIFVLFVPLLLISTNIRFLANQPQLYMYAFDTYGAETNVGLARPELVKVADAITAYFGSQDNGPLFIDVVKNGKPYSLFNQKEATHMQDVKGLIRLDYGVQTASLLYILIFAGLLRFRSLKNFWSSLSKYLAFGGVLTIGLIGLLGLASIVGFSELFWVFHLISFQNNLWLLDPATDNMIRMFPEEFFYDVTLLGVVMTMVEALVLIGLSIVIRKRKLKRTA